MLPIFGNRHLVFLLVLPALAMALILTVASSCRINPRIHIHVVVRMVTYDVESQQPATILDACSVSDVTYGAFDRIILPAALIPSSSERIPDHQSLELLPGPIELVSTPRRRSQVTFTQADHNKPIRINELDVGDGAVVTLRSTEGDPHRFAITVRDSQCESILTSDGMLRVEGQGCQASRIATPDGFSLEVGLSESDPAIRVLSDSRGFDLDLNWHGERAAQLFHGAIPISRLVFEDNRNRDLASLSTIVGDGKLEFTDYPEMKGLTIKRGQFLKIVVSEDFQIDSCQFQGEGHLVVDASGVAGSIQVGTSSHTTDRRPRLSQAWRHSQVKWVLGALCWVVFAALDLAKTLSELRREG